MLRRLLWLQIALAWLPVWALYTLLLGPSNPIHHLPWPTAAVMGLRAVAVAAMLGFFVQRFTEQKPWPHPFRVSFLLLHFAAASVFSVAWFAGIGIVEALVVGKHPHVTVIFIPALVFGIWLYVMIAGVSYASQATVRAMRAEALATASQLHALRAQLNPHFLFNALHTIVQLIPLQPDRAAEAAEQIAALLRTTVQEDRDLVTLREEWAFVQGYLAIERIRFGERLVVSAMLEEDALCTMVPSFALQTLVENAVRHGAAPNVATTTIAIAAVQRGSEFHLTVRDDGVGAPLATGASSGSGLRRLHDRLAALYGSAARMTTSSVVGGGFTASVVIPRVVEE